MQLFSVDYPCCDLTTNNPCKNACRHALAHENSTHMIMDALESGGCGPPLPHDPLWQCFLSTGYKQTTTADNTNQSHRSGISTTSAKPRKVLSNAVGVVVNSNQSTINQLGMDAAKHHCCYLAHTSKCNRLCVQTFTNDWTRMHQRFEMDCYESANELSMRHCLDEVDEPCQLGCDGLDYCTNFNRRPLQLFRSCTANADQAARDDSATWIANASMNSTIIINDDVVACMKNAWRAIACTLRIRPCTRKTHATRICRNDCRDVLNSCLGLSDSLPVGPSVDTICAMITQPIDVNRVNGANENCIQLKKFMLPMNQQADGDSGVVRNEGNFGNERNSTTRNEGMAVSKTRFPCAGKPCASTEVCEIAGTISFGHRCVPGCRLGETSNFIVAAGQYVRIPVVGSNSKRLPAVGCHKMCRCASSGRLEHCQSLPCIDYGVCMMANRRIEHATSISVECNMCSCYAGEITCTKRQCRFPADSRNVNVRTISASANSDDVLFPGSTTDLQHGRTRFTGMPCNCPKQYVPVCGRNGHTYPTSCVAKCAGLSDVDLKFGACDISTACSDVVCPGNELCIPMRHACLSVMQRPCSQYVCVNGK